MRQTRTITGLRTVVVSTLVSVGDIVFSFIVSAITGSTVMFSQGLQGVADLTTTMFLLLGVKKSGRVASKTHPFGYGRELFFWVLISSLFAFLVSGGYASYRAVQQIVNVSPLESVYLALIALGFGLITNGYSLSNSVRRLSSGAKGKSLIKHIIQSSLVETKMTLLVDLMGTVSAVFGIVALTLYQITGNALYDGLGALLIGILTAMGALVVIFDLHDLIVGRTPNPQVIEAIRRAALKVHGVNDVLDLRATSVGSGKVLAILEVHFQDGKSTDEIEQITDNIKSAVMNAEPQVSHVQVEAETPDS